MLLTIVKDLEFKQPTEKFKGGIFRRSIGLLITHIRNDLLEKIRIDTRTGKGTHDNPRILQWRLWKDLSASMPFYELFRPRPFLSQSQNLGPHHVRLSPR